MVAKKILKGVLRSQDWGIFGTTTSFYEMHIGPDVSDPRFQKENLIFCPNFAYFFFLFSAYLS